MVNSLVENESQDHILMHAANSHADRTLCRCLNVAESQVRDAIAVFNCETVREVSSVTAAGSGCNACHCQIRQLITESRQRREMAVVTNR
jgi:bacterioferritin-associated ferredoxin